MHVFRLTNLLNKQSKKIPQPLSPRKVTYANHYGILGKNQSMSMNMYKYLNICKCVSEYAVAVVIVVTHVFT